jgi:hypothetical protein
MWKSGDAIMHDAPDVAEQRIVIRCERREIRDEVWH